MRLRNKKTGEIGKLHCDMNASPTKYGVFEDTDIRGHYWEYDSLAKLNADWEDYAPKEPLIKDEKIRKAVRAWAEACCIETIEITHSRKCILRAISAITGDDEICIDREIGQILDERVYNIDELCGEEEEE